MTSFLHFEPFLKCFQSVYQYLKDFKDLNNPGYIQRLIYEIKPFQITALSNESHIHEYFSTEICQHNPFGCATELKFEQYKLEIQYIDKVFHAT